MSIYNEVIFADAIELVEAIMATQDHNEISDRIEKIAAHPDLALAAIMILVIKAKGHDTSGMTASELANARPTIADLILPPGFKPIERRTPDG